MVKSFFASPVFPGDEDKTTAASMVHHGIIFGLVANLVNIPALILAGDPPLRILVTVPPIILMLLLNLHFLGRGKVRGAAAAFLGLAWLALAAINLTAGGVSAPGFSIHIVLIICVGFIFGKGWAFGAAALSTLLGGAFLLLESRGLLPPSQVENTAVRYWLIFSANAFIIASILTMMVSRLRRSISLARREIEIRRETELELARYQDSLEQTVGERTQELAEANASLLREVEERRLAEEALRREKEFIAKLMETSPVGILVADGEGRFTFANAAAERVLRRTREEITGLGCTSAAWGFTSHDGAPLAPEALPFRLAMTGGDAVRSAPLAIAAPNGTRVLLSISADPLGHDRSRPSGCVITVEDVTERVRLGQEVFRTQKLESVGVLAGGIAHDFNNLLTAIMGNISLAQMDLPGGDRAAASLADAEKAALQARELTQQLLTFSRGGAPVKRTVALAELITESAQLTLRGSRVRSEIALPPDLCAVEADPGQIAQVLHNIILNACQAMPSGGTVRLEARNTLVGSGDGVPLPAGKYVRVTVQDHGEGIAPENLAKVFDPFFSTKSGGTGLGLAVVHSIVRNHGGHVEARSVGGAGAAFSLLLPATARAAPPADLPAEIRPGRGRILLMDDEEMVRQVVSRILAALGYEVRTATEGNEAIALYRAALAGEEPFDAVVLDLTIPGGMGGAEAIRHLRAVDPEVRAIVASGYSNDPVMSNHREHGFVGMIAKPFRAGDLSQTLCEVLRQRLEA